MLTGTCVPTYIHVHVHVFSGTISLLHHCMCITRAVMGIIVCCRCTRDACSSWPAQIFASNQARVNPGTGGLASTASQVFLLTKSGWGPGTLVRWGDGRRAVSV